LTASRWRGIFIGSAGIFVALALLIYVRGWLPGEHALDEIIVGWTSPGFVTFFWWVTQLGNKWFLIPATLLLLWAVPHARQRWWLWMGVVVVAPAMEWLLKDIVGRPRPVGNAYGFPSGHATAASAFFFLATYLLSRRPNNPSRRATILWVGAALIVVLVALSRIVLRAHWPGDTLGGAALGLACVSLAAWWHERSA